MEQKKNTIHAVDRALELLDVLFENKEEMGISEIAKIMHEHKSTIHRTLITLMHHGYVIQNPENEKYSLGYKIYTLSNAIDSQSSLQAIIKPYADKVSEELCEVINVAVVAANSDEFKFAIIYKNDKNCHILNVNSRAFINSECHCSSLGKALLAYSPDYKSHIKLLSLTKYTQNTITSKSTFLEHIKMVQKQGYAMDAEELEIGLTCIGVPIFNNKKEVVSAISASGLTSRMLANKENIIAKLKEVAAEISRKL